MAGKKAVAGLPRSAILMRRVILRRWKRKLLRSFVEWSEARSEEIWPPKTSNVDFISFKQGRYVWAETEKARYMTEWKSRQQEAGIDYVAGCDAIERAWRSTWWDWDDGSRPFFWRWPQEYLEQTEMA
jgi:hypothetical protein